MQPLVSWDCGFEFHWNHQCLSLVSVVCCQVEVSATGQSLVQRNPTECGVSERDREISTAHQGLSRHDIYSIMTHDSE